MIPLVRNAIAMLFLAALAACAPQRARVTTTPTPTTNPWPFAISDVPVDPAYRFGLLDNGMRYVIRHNATPKGTALVRMEIASGSLDETDAERGFAHFVEHMAFKGSTRIPEGEMVKLLERQGLAFGADTNAETSFDRTTYRLDLPRNDPALLSTALMLMRETVSELNFSEEAVERERGVILAERRDRNTWALRNAENAAQFFYPGARFPHRFPIGTEETIALATATNLRAFWQRSYLPARTTVIVIGDLDPNTVETAIRQHFSSWASAMTQPLANAGPIYPKQKTRTQIYIDPAVSERVTASRNGSWNGKPDAIAVRQENFLRSIGYSIINRRLLRLSRQAAPPFRSAGLGTAPVFKQGRSTNLVVDTADGKWREGLIQAATEYRQALRFGFTKREVDEQIEQARNAAQDAAASASTRSHGALANMVFTLLRDDQVPVTPESSLARLLEFAPQITPERVLTALRRDALSLRRPLMRFQGRQAPKGGETALRAAWDKAMRLPLTQPVDQAVTTFAYNQFGPAGTVISDSTDPAYGIRMIRFANGVRLNLKKTDLAADRIQMQLSLDGGDMLNTKTNPLTTDMLSMLAFGGLGKHSMDELDSLFAGRTLGFNIASSAETFVSTGETTRRDLALQMQVLTALISDPGYRKEGETRYRLNINNFFASKDATPAGAMGSQLGRILSDQDPRFTLQPVDTYRTLTMAKLREDITDRLAQGAIEVALVGDFDETQAINLVAQTLGALPMREAEFRPYTDQRIRPFTKALGPHIVRHSGPSDQALLRFTWATRDDSDPQEVQALELLERVLRIEISETLREKLGKAYSPSVSSAPSSTWDGYGTFGIAASVAVTELEQSRAAILQVLSDLRSTPIDADLLQRAREPLLQSWDNALKSNRGWMALTARIQSKPEWTSRFTLGKERLLAVTAANLQALAQRYLTDQRAIEVRVLPKGMAVTGQ